MVVPHDDEADMVVHHDDEASDGDLPFHEANQSDSPAAASSGSTAVNLTVENPNPTHPSGDLPTNVADKKPVHHMEVDSDETVRGGNSNGGYHYATSEGNPVDHTGGRDCFGSSRHPIDLLQGPRRDPSDVLQAPANIPWPPPHLLSTHQPHPLEQTIPTPAPPPIPTHVGFACPNILDYGPLLAQVYVTDVNKAMKEWNREIVPNFSRTDLRSAEEWLRKLSIELRVRFVHPGIWAQADPCTWDTFADWLMKHNPDTSNTEVVANTCRRSRQMPNKRAVDFYNGFCEWQLDAETYGYSHHEITGFVERLEPHLRQHVRTAIKHINSIVG
ncbi:hypothetical protein PSHT_08317 [Puccinia striiformis]|uniref:Uncharacterized protein n=1 Tax=Puccinia striiformis TaxID=27350 RepID=A0A2S4VQM6_9BASI|nr:hypothetical protein PSHT_08317 [Puccinia striiformis]